MHAEHSGFKRILVARGGAIGDFILTLPVFQVLRKHFSNAYIEILGYPQIACLATLDPHADRITRLESPEFTALFTPSTPIPAQTASFLNSFDLIISYLHDPDAQFERRVHEVSKARFIRGVSRPNNTSTSHAAQALLAPLCELGIRFADHEPQLLRRSTPPSSSSTPTLACHPGSGSPSKNWPAQQWLELLQWTLDESSCHLLVVGGEADQPQLDWLQKSLRSTRIEFANSWPLTQLAHRLRSCKGFIGHDSGISHLAAAVGIPTRVLWSWTNPSVWAPVGSHVSLIQPLDSLQHLETEFVLHELHEFILSPALPPQDSGPTLQSQAG